MDLLRALGPILDGDFYRYNGSLTTPPCTESVTLSAASQVRDCGTTIKVKFAFFFGGGVWARETGAICQIGVLARKRCIFLSSKRSFLPTLFVLKWHKTKQSGQDSLFHKKPKLGRKNHYFYSVKMGERAKSL